MEYAGAMNDLPPMPGTAGEATDEPSSSPAVPREPESRPAAPQPAEAVAAEPESPPAAPAPAPAPAATDATAPEAEHFHLPSPPAETALEAAAASPIEAPSTAPARPRPRVRSGERAAGAAPARAPRSLRRPPNPQRPARQASRRRLNAASACCSSISARRTRPDPAAVRRYLKEFLTDPRVIEKNSLIWKLVLNGIILPLRSRRKARDYQKIWNREKDKSPLKTVTRSQAEKLAGILEPLGNACRRRLGDALRQSLDRVAARGADRARLRPHPGHAALSAICGGDDGDRLRRGVSLSDEAAPAAGAAHRCRPITTIPYYIEVLASSLKAELQGAAVRARRDRSPPFTACRRNMSTRAIPTRASACETTQLLREQLKLDENKLMLTFQSRFGRARWLQPYTDQDGEGAGQEGREELGGDHAGFSADCLETLEEIAVENARVFKRHGGENFAAIPCLNDSEAGMLMIWQLAMRELKGWV